MKLRIIGPLLVAAPCAALAVSSTATPASAADAGCAGAAHAYATQEISLIDPLKKLQSCIQARLDKAKDKPDDTSAKKEKINWHGCRATAARFSTDPDTVTTKQLVEFKACVDATIKDFHR
jgi:hypothetical protein